MGEQIYILTPAQRVVLRGLWQAGATSYGTARLAVVVEGFNANVFAILERFELVARRKSGPRELVYLTAAGAGEARKPTERQHG